MNTFTDTHNQAWKVTITVPRLKAVRDELGIDLLAMMSGADAYRALGALVSDLPRFVDTLYVLMRDQADAAGLSDEEFGRRMAHMGETFCDAAPAFFGGLKAYAQNTANGAALAVAIEAGRRVAAELEGWRCSA